MIGQMERIGHVAGCLIRQKDVIIQPGTPFSPRVPDGEVVECRSLMIMTGAVVNIGVAAKLKVLIKDKNNEISIYQQLLQNLKWDSVS